jgi:hypothetical protein
MKNRNEWLGLTYSGLVLSVMISLALAHSGFAGTYNFYFNNTEQGDNSTATPHVNIKEGSAPAGFPSPGPSPIPVIAPAPQAEQPAPSSTPAIVPEEGQQSSTSGSPVWVAHGESPWHSRLIGGASWWTDHQVGAHLDAGFFFKDRVGLNLFAATNTALGLELEVMPIHLLWDSVNVSLVAGAFRELHHARQTSPEFGARVTVYPYPAAGIGISLALRQLLTPGYGATGFAMSELGIAFHI